ncbi:MAG: ImmA/IrrE family metallo-endopeptidase, partial [Deltaproteobacteria bacterium]|nr:ImmA/IrrE family metallo-endopeptidase [Deltaproteobacteria bacterium]
MLRTLPQEEGTYDCLGYILPVPIEKLAEALGVRIQLVEDLTRIAGPSIELENEICGALSRATRTIFVEARLPLEQRRYVIGHEYAHLLYHSDAIHYRQRAARAQASGARGDIQRIRAPHEEREAQRFS